jgi:nicotinate-nucleotide--dimethylbenzimidazole phosphoribosyltransferase
VGSSARRTPVILDGVGAATVGLLGVRASYAAPRWWQAAHRGEDGLHERVLGSLGLEPLLRLDVRLTDGTAALAALALLDTSAALLAPGVASTAGWDAG